MAGISGDNWSESVPHFRASFQHGASVTQEQITELERRWLPPMASRDDSETERLCLVDEQGQAYRPGLTAQRWLAHLLGLRHKAVHVLLLWESSELGPVILCQVRSFRKKDFPGHIDVSVGGHVVNGKDSLDTALREMDEELGVRATDVVEPGLQGVGGYECTIESRASRFLDVEWRDVYLARIEHLDRLYFKDGEVDGLYLCPIFNARQLLDQSALSVANGLTYSLPLCLSFLEAGRV